MVFIYVYLMRKLHTMLLRNASTAAGWRRHATLLAAFVSLQVEQGYINAHDRVQGLGTNQYNWSVG